MSEYRLEELADLSGVSARNIRAYRERGLLDPPRRSGRSALYGDSHLAQLDTINQLLRRGFNSAHIAEFFAGMRDGADLADILGLQRAVPATPTAEIPAAPAPPAARSEGPLDISVGSDEARRLVELGLARRVDGAVALTDPVLGEIVARAADQMLYIRALLRIVESTRQDIDALAAAVVTALEECLTARFGPEHLPRPDQLPEFRQIVRDYRELATRLVVGHLDTVLHRRVVSSAPGALLNGQWPPHG
ncbi:MerR family transcriptional regulator [Mycobacterium sp. NPDC050551]|uniref:MerR family transcriptional regulator n=1 Tax=Mycobacterium sp. NPDC050551 TaxID=3155407 RepID=UPI0034166D9A